MCNVYRRFTKDFAKWKKPRNALVRSTLPNDLPSPTEVEQEAFETL